MYSFDGMNVYGMKVAPTATEFEYAYRPTAEDRQNGRKHSALQSDPATPSISWNAKSSAIPRISDPVRLAAREEMY
jgi:hypothetical protein